MARKNISRQAHGQRFQRAKHNKKQVNQPIYQVRGGIRL